VKDEDKSKEQIIRELAEARKRIADMEAGTSVSRAAEGLLAGENLYLTLAEAGRDIIFLIDRDGYVSYVNSFAAVFFGARPEDIVGRHLKELFPPDAYEAQSGYVGKVLESGRPQFVEENFSFPDRHIWLDTRLIPVMEKDGGVRLVLGLSRDITERKRTEEALLSAEAKFRCIVEQSLVGIYIIGDGKFLYANPKLEEIFGYTRDELLSLESVYTLVAPADVATARNIFHPQLDDVRDIHAAIRCRRKDGTLLDAEVHGTKTVYDGLPAVIGSLLDVTERRKMEIELVQSQKMESLGLLAGGIAHEFNNILTAIVGNIVLAKMYAKPGLEVFDILTEAEKASQRAEDITQQLLTFSKGGMIFKKLTSVREIIGDMLGRVPDNTAIKYEFFLPDDLDAVEVDEGQIRQAVSNLVVNAREAMPRGGKIRLSAENVSAGPESHLCLKEGDYVKLSIEDEGPGIDDAYIEKIFDPFFTTKDRSSGLGLTGSFSIIRNHGGCITVESRPGAGAIFHVYLPAARDKVKNSDDRGKDLFSTRKRILVMDDEEIVRSVIDRMLLQCGCESTFARDGAEMINAYRSAMLQGHPFDAVIVDLVVSNGMGGKEAVGKLLEIDPEAKAIVSSGYSDDLIMSDFRQHGFKGVLAKPYRLSRLNQVLREVIIETA
jgi:PAS domain S-box-containing protein